jgi:pimeloyl-ACP methyl ester carboxylesterase
MLHFETHIIGPEKKWLVFIHGAGGAIATWKYQTEAFKPFFNLLLLDLRDHGLSKNILPEFQSYNFEIVCEDILEVMDHLGIEKAHFISLSLGSLILQQLNEQRPDLIDKMVMAGGVFKATLKMKFFIHSGKILSNILPYETIYTIFSWIVLPKKNHQKSRRLYRLQAKKLGQKAFIKWIGLYRELFRVLDRSFKTKLEKISLIVMGSEDHVFHEAARKFVQRQDKARLEIIQKCGHICNVEAWQQFNKITLNFLHA